MGLRFPTGTRASDLSDPVPGADQVQTAAQEAAAQVAELKPVRAPAGSFLSDQELLAGAGLTDDALLAGAGLSSEVQGPPEAAGLGTPIFGLVRKPNGELAIQEPGGQIRDISQDEREKIFKAGAAIQELGPLAAGFLSGAAGLVASGGNPLAANVAAATGDVAARNVLDPQVSPMLETVTREPLPARTVGQNLMETGAGVLGGEVAGRFGATGLQRIGAPITAAGESLIERGTSEAAQSLTGAEFRAQTTGQNLERAAQERVRATGQYGIELAPEQVNPESQRISSTAADIAAGKYGPQMQARQALNQLTREQEILAEFEATKSRFPALSDDAAERPQSVISRLVQGNSDEISLHKAEIRKAAGNERFDVSELRTSIEKELRDQGNYTSNGMERPFSALTDTAKKLRALRDFIDVRGEAPGQAASRITSSDIDEVVQQIQKRANFKNEYNRSPEENLFGSLYHKAAITRDSAAALAVEGSNPKLATKLRAARDKYAQDIDYLLTWQRALRDDPSNFVKALVKKDNPANARELARILPDEALGQVQRALFENSIADLVNTRGGINATSAKKAFESYGPSTLEAIYGKESLQDLRALFNAAQSIEKRTFKNTTQFAQDIGVKKIEKLNKAQTLSRMGIDAIQYTWNMLHRNKIANEYFGGKLSQPVSAAEYAAEAGLTRKKPTALTAGEKLRSLGQLLQESPALPLSARTAGTVGGQAAAREIPIEEIKKRLRKDLGIKDGK